MITPSELARASREEVLSKEYQRRELVQKRINRDGTQDDLRMLHALDKELSGIDIVGVLFDHIESLQKRVEWFEHDVHTCHADCTRPSCVDHREIEVLKERLNDADKTLDVYEESDNKNYGLGYSSEAREYRKRWGIPR